MWKLAWASSTLSSPVGHRILALLHLCTTVAQVPAQLSCTAMRKGTSCRPPASWRWDQWETHGSRLPFGGPFSHQVQVPQVTSADFSPDTRCQAAALYRPVHQTSPLHRAGPCRSLPMSLSRLPVCQVLRAAFYLNLYLLPLTMAFPWLALFSFVLLLTS